MSKVTIRDLALPAPIQAVQAVGRKEMPTTISREYADFIELQAKENKALVIAHKQLEERLNSLNPEVKAEATAELDAYLDTEIDVKLLPHNLLSQITNPAPMDLFFVRKLMAEPPCKGV